MGPSQGGLRLCVTPLPPATPSAPPPSAPPPIAAPMASHPLERTQAGPMTEELSGGPRSRLWRAGGEVIGIAGCGSRK